MSIAFLLFLQTLYSVDDMKAHCRSCALGIAFFDKLHNQSVVIEIILTDIPVLRQDNNALFDGVKNDWHKLLYKRIMCCICNAFVEFLFFKRPVLTAQNLFSTSSP